MQAEFFAFKTKIKAMFVLDRVVRSMDGEIYGPILFDNTA